MWHQRRPLHHHKQSSTSTATTRSWPILLGVNADLERWWMADVGAGREQSAALDRLLSRYREPHRRYHGERHVEHVRREVAALLANHDLANTVADPGAVALAAWYHDAIYDPRSLTNESDSAELANRELAPLGIASDRLERVQCLILATTHHNPTNADEAVLLDADLAVLAADPPAYEAYVKGVRREYAHINNEGWKVGRANVLRSFLQRDTMFHTEPTTDRNARARANLTAELMALELQR
jgi:predicted metal-dependent HD superfamily phosphohydrolase